MYLNTFNEMREPKTSLGAGLQPRSRSLLRRVSQLSGSQGYLEQGKAARQKGGKERKEALAKVKERAGWWGKGETFGVEILSQDRKFKLGRL